MLYRKLELIPIKTGFFMNFKVAQKSGQTPCTISTGSLAKFRQKWVRENSSFL